MKRQQPYEICSGNLTGTYGVQELQQILHKAMQKAFGSTMGRKHRYATKGQLETLVRRIHRTGILYFEGLAEFRKQFILAVLRNVKWNKSKAARVLGMHRSTLVRALRELKVDVRTLRDSEPRPPHGIRPQQQNKKVG